MVRKNLQKFAILLIVAIMLITQLSPLVLASSEKGLLAGKYISVIGDSISTYAGWSDSKPISDESCTYRYGEAYYGPEGGDYHNTDLTVEDTWWHQAATELGAQILISNAGNSTGVFADTYSPNKDWENYLKDLVGYKSRPYYLGTEERDPDIIAMYLGSKDVGLSVDKFGSIEQTDLAALIKEQADGSFIYAQPQNVAEAYCIMLHKMSITYPDAEIYCFTVVPNSGGYVSTINSRLNNVYPFNEMVRGVAKRFGAHVVELMDEFQLDPDGDAVVTEEDLNEFKSCYNGDPHPNAKGFDVITKAFVDTVLENSRYFTKVETKKGVLENILLNPNKVIQDDHIKFFTKTPEFITEQNMKVSYEGEETIYFSPDAKITRQESALYESKSADGTYTAKGGYEKTVQNLAPELTVSIPLTDTDNPETEDNETISSVYTQKAGTKDVSGDSILDGTYNYTQTEVLKQGSVTVSTDISCTSSMSDYLGEGMDFVVSTVQGNETNGLMTNGKAVDRENLPAPDEIPAGHEYIYIGSDQLSKYWASYDMTAPETEDSTEVPFYTDENGTKLYTYVDHSIFERRGLMIPRMYIDENTVVENYEGKENFPAWYDSVQQYTLSNKFGNIISAYCADQKTAPVKGYGYNIRNVEDANYYSEKEAAMIRTVVLNGYWGTESGMGSMENLKQSMRASGKFTEAEISALNEGIAMTATQYAIWTYSNVMHYIKYLNAYYTNSSSSINKAASKEDTDLLFKLYFYLTSLEPTKIADEDKNTENTIINEENFIKNAQITLKGKVASAQENKDYNSENDIYNADISFELKVTPKENNGDELVIILEDGAGNELATGRIAGTPENGE